MLKLYVGQPVMINQNIDVENSKTNGALCTFKYIQLKNEYQDSKTINIDGYFVQCMKS